MGGFLWRPPPHFFFFFFLSPVDGIMVCQNTHMKGYFVCVVLLCHACILEESGEIFTIEDLLVHRHAVDYSRSDTRC